MSFNSERATRVSLISCSDYLPRIRTIAACVAESAGMDRQEASEVELILTEACVNAIRHGSPRGDRDSVNIVLKALDGEVTADVIDCGVDSPVPDVSNDGDMGFGVRLMRMLADSVQFIKHKTGLTVRLTKRTRAARLVNAAEMLEVHRN